MFRTAAFRSARVGFITSIFRDRFAHDENTLGVEIPSEPKTGWERVKHMYKRDENGEPSVEMFTVAQSSICGAFVGVCLGGFVRSRNAYVYFIETNQATIFKSTMAAKKKLQDAVTLAFAKGAVEWGWRLGAFTGLFSLIATTIQVYRGDTTLMEFVMAGTITGAVYKLNLGLVATLVGAGLGCTLSLISGLAILGLLKASGLTLEEIRNKFYEFKQQRDDHMKEANEKSSGAQDILTKHHDTVVQQRGETKIEQL